jgi:predicted transcriptional regulator
MRPTEIHSTPSPDPIFQMATGFWVSKTLMTAVELEVFSKLSGKSVNIDELQNILRIENRAAEVFVTALVSLGLIEKKSTDTPNGRKTLYSNSQLADIYLDKDKPSTYMGDFISMVDKQSYRRWDKLPQSVKTNKPIEANEGGRGSAGSMFDQARSNQAIEQMQVFTRAMYGVSVGPAMALAKIFDFSNYKKLIDIGGGSGVYAIEVVKENPKMSATVLDLGPACEVANEYIKQFSLENKIQTKVLDYFNQELPRDYDVALLSHIVHLYEEEKARALLKKVYDSLPSEQGIIIISEWLLNDEKTGPVSSALMSLNMIVELERGRNYSFAEISNILTDVGFKNIEKRPLAGPAEIVIGYKK